MALFERLSTDSLNDKLSIIIRFEESKVSVVVEVLVVQIRILISQSYEPTRECDKTSSIGFDDHLLATCR